MLEISILILGSVVLPYQYKYIADRLGIIYAKIRDAIYDESDQNSAFFEAQRILTSNSNPPIYSEGGIYSEGDGSQAGNGAPISGESDDPTNEDYSEWLASTRYVAAPGSIGKDLGRVFGDFPTQKFSYAQAKQDASGYCSAALRALNQHVVRRTHGISSITEYYNTYSYRADAQDPNEAESKLSLFDYGDDGDTPNWSYFSQDFAELSSQIGVTIDSRWIAS